MQQIAYKTLALLGFTGAGSGVGVVVPLSVEYSKSEGIIEVLDSIKGDDSEVVRTKRSVSKAKERHEKSFSKVDDLLSLLFKRNRRQIRYAYKSSDRLIVDHFKKVKKEQQKEWDEIEEGLLNIRKTHQGIVGWQQKWVNDQDKQISDEIQKLKKMVEDIKSQHKSIANLLSGIKSQTSFS